ncbi:uracil-xanthine permease family protein [Pseudohalocynthiibacter aestuariivivens]|jgi:xanthine permease|uniref:Uracil-xanthine permease family protein n=1 Tax=Pseudohalocynthiibacter aestuariivivens TaxID=1591409 RepID=A0ABV5JBD6_9RHOB|nr:MULTISPECIES: nucleobase:cation symporter-2 family protein [Pseudohalocynthiibacter]MBS9715672.1 purine permease [Pseudohalocynthiibacter aestuariivivens]MCK0101285.1 purine permease [Pseudohalocynthiibacter sp. F2068]
MADTSLGTAAQLRDPNYTPPLIKAIPLGIQHVLAMFVSNVTPAIIISGFAGFGYGSDAGALGFPDMTYLIQMSMLFAGIATLLQTITLGPVGAALPIVQGTSFAFIPIMIPLVAGKGTEGLAALFGGVVVGGLFHAMLGTVIGKIRFALPPLVTGLVVMMIGLALVKVGIEYAAGGVPAKQFDKPEYGSLLNWSAASVVIFVTLALKFYARGMLAVSAVLIGIFIGYLYALMMGMVTFEGISTSWGHAQAIAFPSPFKYGFEFSFAAIIGFCLMAFVSAIETVGDVSGITKGGAGREATDREIQGATYADGFGTAFAGIFSGLPNTSFSQNVGLIAMTGVMSRTVVTIGAFFLIICGLIPKVGALILTVPIEVLGGGVIVMFGMVVAAGISMLSDVHWNRRNMVIFAVAISIGLGFQLEAMNLAPGAPNALQQLPDAIRILGASGILPAALIAIILNLILPEHLSDEATEEVSGGMTGHGEGSLGE